MTASPPAIPQQPQQRVRDAERQSCGVTEQHRHRETQETDDTHDSALSASVKTLPEAVAISLRKGLHENVLWDYARAVKAFEITTGRVLQPEERNGVFALWWSTAKPMLPPDADYDEWRYDFINCYMKAKTPLGSNTIAEAIRRSASEPAPEACARFASPRIRNLVSVCFHLQQIAGEGPFFISVRDAAKVLQTKDLHSALAKLNGLISDEILILERKGTAAGRKANRYRYIAPI